MGYANDGLTLYFLCGIDSQKATNLARDNRVSLVIDDDTAEIMESLGFPWQHEPDLSSTERRRKGIAPVDVEISEAEFIASVSTDVDCRTRPHLSPDSAVMSVLDYSKGFGHSDLVIC